MPFGFGKKPEPQSTISERPEEAPGWDAIDAGLRAQFGDQAPLHWGTNTLPNQAAIYGLSAYRDDAIWLLLTYGLSELFNKVSDDPLVSGWGIELTMRVPGEGSGPPAWSRTLIAQLAASIFSTGRVFAPGHRADLGQPITGGDAPTRLTAVAFEADPRLGSILTPNGKLTFLTIVGITADELEVMKASTTASVLSAMAETNPRLITDPAR